MAQTSWPFENIDTSETQYSLLFSSLQGNGVEGVPGDTQLKVTASGTGLTLNISTGLAIVRGFAYNNDSTLAITLNAVTANRYDRIVLRLDPTANSIVAAVVQGTGATTPVLPNLTQTTTGIYELELGYIYLASGTTTATNLMITDARLYLGEQVGKWTTTSRPVAPQVGLTGYNTTLAALEVWSGSAWTPVGAADLSPNFMLMGA